MSTVETTVPPAGAEPLDHIPATLVRAPKVALAAADRKLSGYGTRDWSLYFFFRILPQVEMDALAKRLGELATPTAAGAGVTQTQAEAETTRADGTEKMLFELSQSNTQNGGLLAEKVREARTKGAEEAAKAARPAEAFKAWLTVLVEAQPTKLVEQLQKLAGLLHIAPANGRMTPQVDLDTLFRGVLEWYPTHDDLGGTAAPWQEWLDLASEPYVSALNELRDGLWSRTGLRSRLLDLTLYELLRQAAPAFVDGTMPVIRSEAKESTRLLRSESFDRAPITLAFTFPGLKALGIDPTALASFPDPFKEGMAARATRLCDVGASAPENWEGELGQKSVHGYFATGSNIAKDGPIPEGFWREVREEVRAFNNPIGRDGMMCRAWLGLLFRVIGLEILHIELGQDPYDIRKRDQTARPHPHRREHFGFRDGLSQPFVDLKLGDTLPGGGTADRRGSWRPVAPGEIFLDEFDEGCDTHDLPITYKLRQGSTYLVFRKLEQDVHGFRAFLQQQRPDDARAQHKLAAQMVGRWKNGTPLVRSPEGERPTAGDAEAALNDFRYAADDPFGRKCPLGAHVRRANPRDIGGRNDVRFHRILRRGISYGGPFLPEGTQDDGEKRGLLFVAACARLDVQFEVIQADWLNGGDFLGQTGLGRCPLTGTPPAAGSTFLEAGAVAPVSGVPRFVTMRGGDYFFAPGIPGLKAIAAGETFKPEDRDVPYKGLTMADPATPALFSEKRLKDYGLKLLTQKQVIRVQPRESVAEKPREVVAFLGRHADVKLALGNPLNDDGSGVRFSVCPYHEAARRMTRGGAFLVGTDVAGGLAAENARLKAIRDAGWKKLGEWLKGEEATETKLRSIAQQRLSMSLRRVAGRRWIDLVDDLALAATYGVVEDLLGVPGPRWLTELAPALPFSRQHVGDLPSDWIAAFKGEKPTDPRVTTMQVWMAVIIADLIGNVQDQRPLQALSRQAASEALNHIDMLIAEEAARLDRKMARLPHDNEPPRPSSPTLLEALVANAFSPTIAPTLKAHYKAVPDDIWLSLYFRDVAVLLLELAGTTLVTVPLTFASVMGTVLELRLDLPSLLPRLDKDPEGRRKLIYEAERLRPNLAARLRRCETATEFGKERVEKGDLVVALIEAANKDPRAFPEPFRFSLAGHGPFDGPPRDFANYLLFNVVGSNKHCWGRERVAFPLLEECLSACSRLRELRRVAGPRGEPQKLAGVTIGLRARFARLASEGAGR